MGVAPAGRLELADIEDEAGATDDGVGFPALTSPDDSEVDSAELGGPRGGQIDLPSLLPSNRPSPPQLELPSIRRPKPERMDVELPDLSRGASLPSPVVRRADLPTKTLDLPRTQEAGLPDLSSGLPDLNGELPEIGGRDLPNLNGELPDLSTGLGSLDDGLSPFPDGLSQAPTSLGDEDLEAAEDSFDSSESPEEASGFDDSSADDIFGSGPLPTPESVDPEVGGAADPAAFGEVDFGAGSSDADEEDEEFDAFPTDEGASTASPDQGPDNYGDVALDGGGGDFDLGADVERGEASPGGPAPRGPAAAASAAVELPRDRQAERSRGARKKKRRKTSGLSKGTRIALGVVLGGAVAGGALTAFIPNVGPYGVYWIVDTLNADDYQAQLMADATRAQSHLAKDTSKDIEAAFRDIESGRQAAPRFAARAAYAAYIGFFHQLRFGASSDLSAQAAVMLGELKDVDPSTPYLDLAGMTKEAASGKPEMAVARGGPQLKKGVEYAVVVGEAALRARDVKMSQQAWATVLGLEDSARAHYGMARTLQLASKSEDEVKSHIEAALLANPDHTGSRLIQAEFFLKRRDKDDAILSSLTPLIDRKSKVSDGEKVDAFSILGSLHLRRARLKKAEEAYSAALKIDAGSAEAQRGLAQVLFQSGRYSEALARFEGAVRADPGDLSASLGVVRCQLRLEQLQDAVKILDRLSKEHPDSAAVAYWVGRGKEAIGEKDEAQAAYERATKNGDDVPELVLSYIALTRLLGQKGNLEEAKEVIHQAKERFPEDPAVYEALGELAASAGRYDDAVDQFDKAIELDPNNLGLRFSRGIVLRQGRRFQQAAAEFDFVEKESPQYPGLALERGNLYEASGETERALKAYEAALKAAPDDMDLQLRVACGRASAGQSEPAIELLRPIVDKRQDSAEVNFCFGLAYLNGGDLAQARQFVQRAVAKDPTRAKHHLYTGWIALSLNDLPVAQASLDRALELDKTLADAYWKRGELRVRQKAVLDAIKDLDKALELAPHRSEALAQKGLAYIELGKEQEAMAAFSQAVEQNGAGPYFRYKYGELLLANRRPNDAEKELEAAVTGAETEKTPPVWLPNAHRLLAVSMGPRRAAIKHYEVYIDAKKGDPQDPYLREAVEAVNRIMKSKGFD